VPAPAYPVFSEIFVVNTLEVDDTNNGSISVMQTIIHDSLKHRSRMIADGMLVQGHLEQDMRCDSTPKGYLLNMHGDAGSEASTWQCINQTMTSTPASSCGFDSPFWALPPANATWEGKEAINGTIMCDKWVWWTQGEKFAMWVTATKPVRSARIFTSKPGHHLYHIDLLDFQSFKGSMVPLSYFQVPAGVICEPQAHEQAETIGNHTEAASSEASKNNRRPPVPATLSSGLHWWGGRTGPKRAF
jgi:hypothetical protein